MQSAIESLRIAAEVCEHNAPLNDAAGNADQAAIERKNAAEYRAAIEVLKGHKPDDPITPNLAGGPGEPGDG